MPDPIPEDEQPDPALVEAMRERVVKRQQQDYGKRKAGPGRPKGSGKVPGSGRRAGSPNVWSPEFREHLNAKAKPFELLADICAGKEIDDGGTKRKPTMPERMRAAETLTRKILPDLSASAVNHTASPPDPALQVPGALSPELELARRIAFMLAQAQHRVNQQAEADANKPRLIGGDDD